jgi:hypothetical protein
MGAPPRAYRRARVAPDLGHRSRSRGTNPSVGPRVRRASRKSCQSSVTTSACSRATSTSAAIISASRSSRRATSSEAKRPSAPRPRLDCTRASISHTTEASPVSASGVASAPSSRSVRNVLWASDSRRIWTGIPSQLEAPPPRLGVRSSPRSLSGPADPKCLVVGERARRQAASGARLGLFFELEDDVVGGGRRSARGRERARGCEPSWRHHFRAHAPRRGLSGPAPVEGRRGRCGTRAGRLGSRRQPRMAGLTRRSRGPRCLAPRVGSVESSPRVSSARRARLVPRGPAARGGRGRRGWDWGESSTRVQA